MEVQEAVNNLINGNIQDFKKWARTADHGDILSAVRMYADSNVVSAFNATKTVDLEESIEYFQHLLG